MSKDLTGHRAVITGASSGLGEEFARQLAARGADLVIAARREDRLKTLAEKLEKEHGVKVIVARADLSKPGAAEPLYQAALSSGGPVTMLLNNAGIGPYTPFLKESRERHVETIQLNVVALTELSHLFARHMHGHGKRSYILNVGSIAGYQGAPNFAVYASTKSYVRVFSEILALESAGTALSVTCLCPGGALTEFSAANHQNVKSDTFMMTAESVVTTGLAAMFAGRATVVPGFFNKVACFAPRLLPSGVALRLAAKAMEKNVSSTK